MLEDPAAYWKQVSSEANVIYGPICMARDWRELTKACG